MTAAPKKAATKAVAKITETPSPQSDSAVILSMIDKISARPDVDVERIEKMFDLYIKAQADAAQRCYQESFAEMQPKLPIIKKRGKSHNAKYAKWEHIVGDIMPILKRHGFALSFDISPAERAVNVTCILMHRGGHRETTSFPYPFDASGSKNPIQAIGS